MQCAIRHVCTTQEVSSTGGEAYAALSMGRQGKLSGVGSWGGQKEAGEDGLGMGQTQEGDGTGEASTKSYPPPGFRSLT